MRIIRIAVLCFIIQNVIFPQSKNTYEVYAIEYAAQNYRTPATDVAVGALPTDSISTSFFIWYLKGDNGKKILVDTGFLKDSTKSYDYMRYFIGPDQALKKIRVIPEEITDVIITHAHFDHIGGIGLFKNATLWMQKKEYTYFVGDAWQKSANHVALDKKDVMNIVGANLDGRIQLVDGDSIEIIPGILVFTGSRHTYESQYLLVNTKTENVLLASDDCWYYYNLDHLLPITLQFDADAYVRGLCRMKTLTNPDLIIPGHDALVLTRFPLVAKGIVKIR